jgi:beta-lactamase class A
MNTRRRRFMLALSGLALGRAWSREVPAALGAYERRSQGRVGVYVENLASGARFQWRADERFVMCSSFKASLAGYVLARVDRHEDDLGSRVAFGAQDLQEYAPVARAHLAAGFLSVEQMCDAMLEVSDNTCANLLLARVGGPAAMTAFWRSIGDSVTRLDHYEPELNRSPPGDPHDTTTPAAMAASLQRLALGDVLSRASRERLVRGMLNCKSGANRLRAGVPSSWKVADRTGNNGRDAAADIALVWRDERAPTLVCVYTQGGSPTDDDLTEVFTQVGRMLPEV